MYLICRLGGPYSETVNDVLKRIFHVRGHSFPLYGPTLSRKMTYFFPALNWLTSGFVYATLSSNWLTCHRTTELFVKDVPSERASNSNTKRTNMYLKNISISNYFSSPIKFSKLLTGMKFGSKFEIVIHVQKQLLSVVLNHSKSSLFTAN